MNKTKWFVFIIALTFVASGAFAQNVVLIDQLVTAVQIAAANGTMQATPEEIALTADGKYIMVEVTDRANEKIYLIDPSANPMTFMLLTDENAMKAKVDAVNGASAAPAALSIVGIGVDEDGQIIIATDAGGTEYAHLFRLNPETGGLVLLSGLDAPPASSSIEGLTGLSVRGRRAYLLIEENFGEESGNVDSVVTVSVDAPDGGQTAAQVLTSRTAFEAVQGGLGALLAFRTVGFLPNGNLVISNSATGGLITDDLLEINVDTGAVSVLVAGTDIEADLGVSDIGQNGGAIDPDGTIYQMNSFGITGHPSQRSIIVIRNAGKGVADTSILATEAAIIASPNITDINGGPLSRLFLVNNAAVSPGIGQFVFVDGNCDCLLRLREIPAGNSEGGRDDY